jgi:hypothetical protein
VLGERTGFPGRKGNQPPMQLRLQYQTTFDMRDGKGSIPIASWSLEGIQAVAQFCRDGGGTVGDIRTAEVVVNDSHNLDVVDVETIDGELATAD